MATTRTGYPAIQTPRALELRAVQQSVDNIRERFQGVEAQLALISSVVGASTTGQAILSLQAQVNNLLAALNALVGQVSSLSTDSVDTPPSAAESVLAELEKRVRSLEEIV